MDDSALPSSSSPPENRLPHRIRSIPVIFHPDENVCPRSKGSAECPHDEEGLDGLPYFEDNVDEKQIRDVPDLRKLAGFYELAQKVNYISNLLPNGINGLRLLRGDDGELPEEFSHDNLSNIESVLDQIPDNLNQIVWPGKKTNVVVAPPESFNSATTGGGIRTDSGVGDSLEESAHGGSGKHPMLGFFPGGTAEEVVVNRVPSVKSQFFPSFRNDPTFYVSDEEEEEGKPDEEVDVVENNEVTDGERDDSARPLPSRREIKRYAKKQRKGLSLLSNITPQQLAAMSPEVKSSMDQFLQKLEGLAEVRIKMFLYNYLWDLKISLTNLKMQVSIFDL